MTRAIFIIALFNETNRIGNQRHRMGNVAKHQFYQEEYKSEQNHYEQARGMSNLLVKHENVKMNY